MKMISFGKWRKTTFHWGWSCATSDRGRFCSQGVGRIIPGLKRNSVYEIRFYNQKPRGESSKVHIRLVETRWDQLGRTFHRGKTVHWSRTGRSWNTNFRNRSLYLAVLRLFGKRALSEDVTLYIKAKEIKSK